ncbi:hypothetical protein AcV7_010245 [Taiwanofungus camphoratus]|nr:hypothetical protein AcV7_010245 [Antrodia cinnamomea]
MRNFNKSIAFMTAFGEALSGPMGTPQTGNDMNVPEVFALAGDEEVENKPPSGPGPSIQHPVSNNPYPSFFEVAASATCM